MLCAHEIQIGRSEVYFTLRWALHEVCTLEAHFGPGKCNISLQTVGWEDHSLIKGHQVKSLNQMHQRQSRASRQVGLKCVPPSQFPPQLRQC